VLGGDNDVGHATTIDKINTTAMLFLGTILSDFVGDPIGRRVTMDYVEVLINWDGSMKWCKRKKKQP
jgi:hypothetical protein